MTARSLDDGGLAPVSDGGRSFGVLPAALPPPKPPAHDGERHDGEPVASFKEVYDDNFRFVWRSLRRLGVPESDVADAVQDVFLVVHRRLSEFEGRSKVTTWLYGICYRVARDRRRLAHVRRRADDDGLMDERPDDSADVAATAERNQGLALLETILDEMPIEQRAVFTLFELDAMGGEAIADVLEIPVGTVYSRLRIAREAFRRSLSRMQARDRFRVAGGER